ncbi:MAG TPA: hypothetical protein ENH41_00205 [Candidatus Omnitrophica bacterium]|nr:hypothetical protein [Candidatus Omnitrophota bacterium]
MLNIFSASEIAQIAIQIEENGKDFYGLFAEKAKDSKTKEIFKFLLSEEEEHIAVFTQILTSIEKYEPVESYPPDYFAYMNALASGHIFSEKDRGRSFAAKVKTYAEAIDAGIQVEKDSILFYEGMKKVTTDRDKKIIDQIISQEQNHLRKLSEIRGYLLERDDPVNP